MAHQVDEVTVVCRPMLEQFERDDLRTAIREADPQVAGFDDRKRLAVGCDRLDSGYGRALFAFARLRLRLILRKRHADRQRRGLGHFGRDGLTGRDLF